MSLFDRFLLGVLALIVAIFLTAGCSAPTGFPKEFSQTARAVAVSMTDQAVWERLMARLRGHINNPGLRFSAGIEYYTEFKIIGTDGDVWLEGNGTGTGTLSPKARTALLQILDDSDDSELTRLIRDVLRSYNVTPEKEATNGPVIVPPA